MNSKLLALVTLAVLHAAAAPAGASHERVGVVFEAPVPCGLTCPGRWPEGLEPGACDTDFDDRRIPSSWDEVTFTVPPTVDGSAPALLRAGIWSEVQYDLYVCRVDNPGLPNEERMEIAVSRDGGSCTNPFLALACAEVAAASVSPGDMIVLRAYNVADLPYTNGWYELVPA